MKEKRLRKILRRAGQPNPEDACEKVMQARGVLKDAGVVMTPLAPEDLAGLRQREAWAALTLQAHYRGYRSRQRVRALRNAIYAGDTRAVGHARAAARAAAQARGDPACKRLEGRSSHGRLRHDTTEILVEALVQLGESGAQHAGEWAVRVPTPHGGRRPLPTDISGPASE